jgi:hypothetical protein
MKIGLRSKIEQVIRRSADDPAKAALAICILLEMQVGLSGSGWFDDDQTVLDALETLPLHEATRLMR